MVIRILTLAALVLATIPLCLALPTPRPIVAALYPPWWSPARAFRAAEIGGVAIRPAGVPFVVLVGLRGAQARARLRDGGAWLIFDALGAAGCAGAGRPFLTTQRVVQSHG